LAVFVSLDRKDAVFENSSKGHRDIVGLCRQLGPERICLEATGGYETKIMLALSEAGLPASRVNPKQVRDFAKGHGFLYKTDRIDAEMLALFAQQIKPRISVLPSKELRVMSALSRRRDQVIKMLTAEKNRLPMAHKEVRRELKSHIRYLESGLSKIDEKIASLFKNSPLWKNAQLIETVPGLAGVTSFTLVTEMPELGHASNRTISALAGVAPFTQRSGKWKGKERIQGGREHLRGKLFMAAFNVVQHNSHFRKMFERLKAKGKPYKVAMVAVMRKLICLCNSLIKNQKPWNPALT
jgi:transposase